MKIYDYTRAPNPRRVRIYLAEKGITVPYEQVDILKRENKSRHSCSGVTGETRNQSVN